MSSAARPTSSAFVRGRVRRVDVERGPVGRRVVAEAGGAGDHAALRLDRLELVEADPVDLLRVELERRPAPDLGPVEGSPLGADQRPGSSRLAARYSPRSASRKARSAGIDDVADDLADPLAVRLGRDLDHRRDDRRSIGTASIRSIWAIVRSATMRGAVRPRGQPVAQDLGVGGHVGRVGVQPGDERLEPLGRVGRLELGQLRQQLLRTAHLVDDPQLVEVLVVLLDLEVGDDLEHVAGDPVLGRQAVGRDGGRLRGGPLHQRSRAPPGRPVPDPRAGRRSARRRRPSRSSG